MDWHLIVPREPHWGQVNWAEAREVRLRPGQPPSVLLGASRWQGAYSLTPADVTQAAQALTGHALAARQAELCAGYVPLPGGHRLGVCGVMGSRGLMEITSLCVRLAHEVPGAGQGVFPQVQGHSTLIAGPPGSGKTTLLRGLARLYAQSGAQVGIADERGEIAACAGGAPQLDVGPNTDVVTGMEKAKALMLLIRAMAPQVAAVDEIGGEEEARAVLEAAQCGVTVLATAHSGGGEDAFERSALKALLAQGAFQHLILLTRPGADPQVVSLPRGGGA